MMRNGFTGRHMAASMVGFFTVVIAVNVTMATVASRTFGGTVVDNSYVASQHFNRWLDEAAAERKLGWTISADRSGDRADVLLRGTDGPIAGATVTAIAQHPLGRDHDRPLRFESLGHGQYRSTQSLPAGRWRLRIEIRNGKDAARFVDEVPA
ncbi:FixH family protein [Rhizorhabdus phycosphaerae]|uniref:FixH family protein n=1 Tax=Rhizorhabdus phycosphaerae TaxID=2711156 RepID=UPI0031ED36DB